jgi:hypothetical protein
MLIPNNPIKGVKIKGYPQGYKFGPTWISEEATLKLEILAKSAILPSTIALD